MLRFYSGSYTNGNHSKIESVHGLFSVSDDSGGGTTAEECQCTAIYEAESAEFGRGD